MKDSIKIVLIPGSARRGRFGDKVLSWVSKQLQSMERDQISVETADPRLLTLRSDHQVQEDEGYQKIREMIQEADAFIIITPEFNHGYPASLKLVIDSHYKEWQAKPVAFVSYGGQSGGIRAVEQLRQVFNELHTVCIRENVSFINAWELFDENGALLNPDRSERSFRALIKQLLWWAHALKKARSSIPYEEALV